MNILDHENGIKEIDASGVLINEPTDILDILAESNANTLIIRKNNLNQEFFKLGFGFAGEMLQKISNYRKRIAIIGDFSTIKSKPLKNFIFESNRNKQVVFVQNVEEALNIFK